MATEDDRLRLTVFSANKRSFVVVDDNPITDSCHVVVKTAAERAKLTRVQAFIVKSLASKGGQTQTPRNPAPSEPRQTPRREAAKVADDRLVTVRLFVVCLFCVLCCVLFLNCHPSGFQQAKNAKSGQ